jgi:hypothetical protein
MKKKRNKKIIDLVKARDGRCVGCGRMDGLDVHHVKSWGPHLEDDPLSMVTLCRICHTKIHLGDPELRQRIDTHLTQISSPTWVVDYPLSEGNRF